MSNLKWAKKLRLSLGILIPVAVVAGILISYSLIQINNAKIANSKLQDQVLSDDGFEIKTSIKQVGSDSTNITGGKDVKITIDIINSSDQKSRFITLKTGFQNESFTYLRNVKGANSIETMDGEITFKNIVIEPQQSQQISFDATAFSFDNKIFTVQSSLIDTSERVVAKSNTVEYKVLKGKDDSNGQITVKEIK